MLIQDKNRGRFQDATTTPAVERGTTTNIRLLTLGPGPGPGQGQLP